MNQPVNEITNEQGTVSSFCHLHVHTEYSLLDGMSRPLELCQKAKDMGMNALAITDHGAMYGVIKFYQAAKKAGIKPILGCEFYVAPGGIDNRDKKAYHLTLLAKSKYGYKNLIKLATIAQVDGFYYSPRIDRKLLQEYATGLVAMSGCLAGEVPQLIKDNKLKEAREAALWHKAIFEDYYFELQLHPIPELQEVNYKLVQLSKELGIPLVATNDLHYVNKEDAEFQDLLLCVGTGKIVTDENRMRMDGNYYYLASPQEMAAKYAEYPQALAATQEIADKCNLELDFGSVDLPSIPLPKGYTAISYLRELALPGLSKYYPDASIEVLKRFEYEMDVIDKTKFADYILVTWEIIRFAKEKNIKYGIRGSAASSIVLRCLEITAIDPIKYQLVFERFLNIERQEMPDIDMDFEDKRRGDVIDYVAEKYGHDHVAQIVTFGTLGAKQAVRDTARVLNIPLSDADRVSKLIPDRNSSLKDFITAVNKPSSSDNREILALHKELLEEYNNNYVSRDLIEKAAHLEGVARHAGVHAAGVVIAAKPLSETIPLARPAKLKKTEESEEVSVVTQFDMDDIHTLGLLKMDFLGLVNHTILGKTLELIKQSHGLDIDLHNVPLDDIKTYELLSRGDTTGIFQLESAGMRKHIRNLKPDRFEHIIAMVALYRPGPMENIPRYIDGRHGGSHIRYPHESLKAYLEETYGIIVYQEQVLLIAQAFSGYTMGQADNFRKAMGKKKIEIMMKEKQAFIEKAVAKGHNEELAEQVFAQIEPFAGYAFNKAHAASYALVAYHTAYFKANYPVEYMLAYLYAQSGKEDKIIGGVAECRRLGISVLPPSINKSQESFYIEEDQEGRKSIRFGLAVIKNVGEKAIAKIAEEREQNGFFKSAEDFFERIDNSTANKRVIESLVKAGVFDEFYDREFMLDALPDFLDTAEKRNKHKNSAQTSMFGDMGEAAKIGYPQLKPNNHSNIKVRLLWEKELTGLYLSEHPFGAFAKIAADNNASTIAELEDEKDGVGVLVAGSLTTLQRKISKDGKYFAIGNLEDMTASCEVVFWSKTYEDCRDILAEGEPFYIMGNLKKQDEGVFSIVVNEIVCISEGQSLPIVSKAKRSYSKKETGAFNNGSNNANSNVVVKTVTSSNNKCQENEKVDNTSATHITLNLKQTGQKEEDINKLRRLSDACRRFPGSDKVYLYIQNNGLGTLLDLSADIKYCQQMHNIMAEIVGEDGITTKET